MQAGGLPHIPIEIFSPANARRTFKRKIDLYLKNGALAAWVVYPEKKTVAVHTAEGSTEFGEGDSIHPLRPGRRDRSRS